MNFIAATCPSCSGALQLPENQESVLCMYCGTRIIVRESSGASRGTNIATLFKLANAALSAGNPQESLEYCNRILEVDPDNAEAWFLKGASAGWLSTLASPRISELMACMKRAYELTNEQDREEMGFRISDEVTTFAGSFYKTVHSHFLEFKSLESARDDYIEMERLITQALVDSIPMCHSNLDTFRLGIKMKEDLISNGYTGEYIRNVKETLEEMLEQAAWEAEQNQGN